MKQGNQTQVMNEVDTGASGSSCGGGGGGGGGRGGEGYKKEWRNQGNWAEKRQQRGWASFFLSECLPRHLQSLQEKVQAQKIKYSRFSPVLQFIHLDYRTSFRVLQISAEEMSSSF